MATAKQMTTKTCKYHKNYTVFAYCFKQFQCAINRNFLCGFFNQSFGYLIVRTWGLVVMNLDDTISSFRISHVKCLSIKISDCARFHDKVTYRIIKKCPLFIEWSRMDSPFRYTAGNIHRFTYFMTILWLKDKSIISVLYSMPIANLLKL